MACDLRASYVISSLWLIINMEEDACHGSERMRIIIITLGWTNGIENGCDTNAITEYSS